MKKVMVVFGTRPEAIKMCPLVNELKKRNEICTLVCVSGQHREMLDRVLGVFGVVPDFDLSVMKCGQTLFDVTSEILVQIKPVLESEAPDIVLVHGDTSTAFAAALACFYLHIPTAHVEAGLRTHDIASPFPEEFNRRAISLIAKYHFAPTEQAKVNLICEGVPEDRVFVTGNTAIDALKTTVGAIPAYPVPAAISRCRLIVMTAHRRESLGEPMRRIFRAVRRIADEYPDVGVIYPVHMNPTVRDIASEELAGCERIFLVEPLDPIAFHSLISRCYLLLTDSGGIQEEAPSLGKPVLVTRDATERPEGIAAGTLRLVGTDEKAICDNLRNLLNNRSAYDKMACAENPYGDGFASHRIADIIECL